MLRYSALLDIDIFIPIHKTPPYKEEVIGTHFNWNGFQTTVLNTLMEA